MTQDALTPIPRKVSQAMLAFLLLGLSSCKSFKVDLQSPEPIKVDVNMRLDVYQYKGDEPEKPNEEQARYDEAQTRIRNRLAEIQTFKNNGLVGEDHRGLLFLREKPAGEWGDRVEKEVNEENEDRNLMIRHEAKASNRAMHEVQEEFWKQRTNRAFHGEWIEVAGDKPNTFKWVQSDGPREKPTADATGGNKPAAGTTQSAPGS
ncbi:uncharacterized protein DUF1318 [Roseimicrobium gellanilyticum]|uniref:Uncharacterized protein DUF1318 n=1 Tax=Roseimicrobium gellanilyticum TaxID=748857 RepID=A0A366H8R1_9BACT|nr:DUF1318 domain-containing protein [Roseimicrobium gellanilyticum]RBP38493.1 uncharacterized protein DUF1318 [Roseimicrobium gellanilyticum]